jgi:hypothetical protein
MSGLAFVKLTYYKLTISPGIISDQWNGKWMKCLGPPLSMALQQHQMVFNWNVALKEETISLDCCHDFYLDSFLTARNSFSTGAVTFARWRICSDGTNLFKTYLWSDYNWAKVKIPSYAVGPTAALDKSYGAIFVLFQSSLLLCIFNEILSLSLTHGNLIDRLGHFTVGD